MNVCMYISRHTMSETTNTMSTITEDIQHIIIHTH